MTFASSGRSGVDQAVAGIEGVKRHTPQNHRFWNGKQPCNHGSVSDADLPTRRQSGRRFPAPPRMTQIPVGWDGSDGLARNRLKSAPSTEDISRRGSAARRGAGVWPRPVQSSVSGLCHLLRVPAQGTAASQSQTEAAGRASLQICRGELPCGPGVL